MSKPVLLIRAHGNEADADELAKLVLDSLIDPYLQITVSADVYEAQRLLSLLESSPGPLWLIATSVNAIGYWAELVGEDLLRKGITSRRDLNFAAVGNKTAEILHE